MDKYKIMKNDSVTNAYGTRLFRIKALKSFSDIELGGYIETMNNLAQTEDACVYHVSYPTYWDEGDTLIACEVGVDDIITIQDIKVRCKKLKVLGVCDD